MPSAFSKKVRGALAKPTPTDKKYRSSKGGIKKVYSSGGKYYVKYFREGRDGKRHGYFRQVKLGVAVDGVYGRKKSAKKRRNPKKAKGVCRSRRNKVNGKSHKRNNWGRFC